MRIKFIQSAVLPKDYPRHSKPEVAILGRSNSGKSSFINALTSQKVAHVSKQAGKTRLLNFFSAGDHYCLVDLPGYGFASRDNKEMEMWKQMIEDYLLLRENLVGFLLIVDSRRGWSEDEEILSSLAARRGLKTCLVLTKKDKLTRQEAQKVIPQLKKESGWEDVFLCSNLDREGVEDVETFIFENWIKK